MDEVNVWVCPANKKLPIRSKELRVAVGNPTGISTNSWKIWVRKNDVYVACRDNFQVFKVSLHASGIWRIGFTKEFASARSDLVPPGNDRVWKKWSPAADAKLVLGFQLACPTSSLYLSPSQRKEWPQSVLFVDPPPNDEDMAVLSVAIVMGLDPVTITPQTTGAVVGILPLGERRTVQVVATYENAKPVLDRIEDAGRRVADSPHVSQVPPAGVFFVHGERPTDVPWFSAVPYSITRGVYRA